MVSPPSSTPPVPSPRPPPSAFGFHVQCEHRLRFVHHDARQPACIRDDEGDKFGIIHLAWRMRIGQSLWVWLDLQRLRISHVACDNHCNDDEEVSCVGQGKILFYNQRAIVLPCVHSSWFIVAQPSAGFHAFHQAQPHANGSCDVVRCFDVRRFVCSRLAEENSVPASAKACSPHRDSIPASLGTVTLVPSRVPERRGLRTYDISNLRKSLFLVRP